MPFWRMPSEGELTDVRKLALEPIEFEKEITLEEHIKHASTHLGRADAHLADMGEHVAEATQSQIGKAAAASNERTVGAMTHLVKGVVALGQAYAEHGSAVRHLNALNGNADWNENPAFKKGGAAAEVVGHELDMADEHLGCLTRHSIVPIGEDGPEAQARGTLAAHHEKKLGEHAANASAKIGEAKKALDGSLDAEGKEKLEKANPHHDHHGNFSEEAKAYTDRAREIHDKLAGQVDMGGMEPNEAKSVHDNLKQIAIKAAHAEKRAKDASTLLPLGMKSAGLDAEDKGLLRKIAEKLGIVKGGGSDSPPAVTTAADSNAALPTGSGVPALSDTSPDWITAQASM